MKKLILIAGLSCASCLAPESFAMTRAAEADEPICVVVHVDVMPRFATDARNLLRAFAAESRKDPGAIRVEVFEELSRPNHSTVVAIWKDRTSYEDHLAADHTRVYRTKLQPMLGSPFDERLHHESK